MVFRFESHLGTRLKHKVHHNFSFLEMITKTILKKGGHI